MRLLPFIVLVTFWAVRPATAQLGPPLRLPEPAAETVSTRAHTRVGLSPGLYTPAGRAAAQAFHRARAQGRLQRPAKTAAPLTLGDTLRFNTQRFPTFAWQPTHFTLMAEGDGYRLWVETAERDNGHVQESDVAAFAEALAERTPAGSVNPDAGLLANNASLFGDVPDVDGDGTIDVLWFNIRDLYPSPEGPIVFGYMAPEDYDPAAPAGTGNGADVLYVDTDPLLVDTDNFGLEEVEQVAVRIHQQLIHFNQDPDEHPFVVRGLAEWAKLLNGYPGSGAGSLQDVREHNIPFFFWALAQPFFGDVQRAALFTAYLAEQFSRDAVTALVREPADGADAYRALAAGEGSDRSLEDLVLDYHTANYLNDPALDSRFGYSVPAYRDARARPTLSLDASTGTAVPPLTVNLAGGGILYAAWENVYNLTVTATVASEIPRDRVRLRAVLEEVGDRTTVVDLPSDDDTHRLDGNFERATLLFFYAELDDVQARAPVTFAATWEGPAVFTQNTAYEAGEIAAEAPNFIALDPESRQATRFAVPPGARLTKVRLAPYYRADFNAANDQVRDFTLHVWADDGTGRPGDEYLALPLADTRPNNSSSRSLTFLDVDLTAYPEVAGLSDVLYVGLSNAGTDDNHLVLALAPLAVDDNPSLVYTDDVTGTFTWLPLNELSNQGRLLADRVVPIRAQFRNDVLRTNVDVVSEIPTTLTLAPNYPNPFNPTTTIAYTLPQAAHVRLTVYDLLGREVAVLVDAAQGAGAYEVPLDASGWAGGLYVYALATDRHRLSRTMVLVK